MPRNRVEQQLRQVSALSDAQAADGLLLEAFLVDRDEAAFTALVRRYGSMVFGICRRVLRHQADAEDAFQATFLVLVRRAAQVRCRATLGNWLYGVAYRTALHARTVNARRRRLEGQVRPIQHQDSPEEAAMRPELQQVLDHELNRLPAKCREAIVLCDLLGKTLREAARELRCPEGTVCSRLARGRELLRKRLLRSGQALSAGALAAYLAQNKAPASALVIEMTVKTAALLAAGKTMAAAGLAPNAAALMDGVLKMMLLTKLKIATGLLLVLAVLGATTSLIACRSLAGPPTAPPTPAPEKAPGEKAVLAKEDEKPPVDRGRFRYDGKDFAHWQDVLRTDLKPEVRMEALKALGAFGVNGYAEEATATIFEMVRGYDPKQMCADDWNVLQCANQTLARLGTKALAALTKAYDNGQKDERLFVIATLRFMIDRAETVQVLMRAAKDKDVSVRYQAISALYMADRKSKGLPAILIGALSDENRGTRCAAADGLGRLGAEGKAAVPDLSRTALKDEAANVRLRVVEALIAIRPEPDTLVPVLATVLEQDKDANTRSSAAQYFRALGPDDKDHVPALIAVLKDPRRTVGLRRVMIATLGQIGPAAKEAVPVLLEILGDKDIEQELRDLTAKVLKMIQPSSAKKP